MPQSNKTSILTHSFRCKHGITLLKLWERMTWEKKTFIMIVNHSWCLDLNGSQGKLVYSTNLPLSWSDTCLEPLYIWARCGMHAPRPESDTGFYSWHLVPSVSESKTTDEKRELFCHKAMTSPENKKRVSMFLSRDQKTWSISPKSG